VRITCVKYAADETFVSACESQRCLVTGKNVTDGGSDGNIKYEACCAWDFAIWLYQDTTLTADEIKEVTIPAVYITMQQAMEFLDLMNGVSSNNGGDNGNNNKNGDPIVLSMYARDRPSVNSSAIIIWALGVFVAWLASYLSSSDYRSYAKAIRMTKSHLVARAGGVRAVAATTAAGGQGRENVERPPPSPARHDGTPRSVLPLRQHRHPRKVENVPSIAMMTKTLLKLSLPTATSNLNIIRRKNLSS